MVTQRRRFLLQHNKKTVVFLDHTNLEGAEYLKVVEENIAKSQAIDVVQRLILVDSTGSIMDREVLGALKKLTSQSSDRIDKVALLGITGIQRLFVRTVASFSKTNIKPFDSQEEALDWLTAP